MTKAWASDDVPQLQSALCLLVFWLCWLHSCTPTWVRSLLALPDGHLNLSGLMRHFKFLQVTGRCYCPDRRPIEVWENAKPSLLVLFGFPLLSTY